MNTLPHATLEFVDNPLAPEVFALNASGFGNVLGNIVITFESVRFNHDNAEKPASRLVVLRLVLPVSGAQNLALTLHDYLAKSGLDPVQAVTHGETAQ